MFHHGHANQNKGRKNSTSLATKMKKTIEIIDRLNDVIGKSVAWLTLAMVVVTFLVVVLRYAFSIGWIAMQESVVYLHSVVFMLGAAYTLKAEEHVRVDVFYRSMSERQRAWVDLIGVLLFLLPLCVFLGWKSFDFVTQSWSIREASRESGGLPYPFISMLKSVLLLMPLTVGLQGLSIVLNSLKTLRGR